MSRSFHLLVVDEDRADRDLLTKDLVRHGFRASEAADARAAQKILETAKIDLIILGLRCLGEDGIALFQRFHASRRVPVLILAALAAAADRIIGLELGAADCMAKPFNPREVAARANVILRRLSGPESGGDERAVDYVFDGWRLGTGGRVLTAPNGRRVKLSVGEFELLLALVRSSQRVLSRRELLNFTRRGRKAPLARSIDIQISRLRRKIETVPEVPAVIRTIRDSGYMFTVPVSRVPAVEPTPPLRDG